MLKTKIKSQKEFEKQIELFEKDYFNGYIEAKEDAINLESFYIKQENDYKGKINSQLDKFPINQALIFIQEWRFNNNSKKNFKTDFEIITLFCKKEKHDLQVLAIAIAEFHAVKNVFAKLLRDKAGKQKKSRKGQDTEKTFIPKRFDELFRSPELINDCLKLLKEMDQPAINDENGFIENKGVLIVWLNTLEVKNMFNYSFKNDKERAETLKINFKGLNISASLFRQKNKRPKEMYKSHFESEISALKH